MASKKAVKKRAARKRAKTSRAGKSATQKRAGKKSVKKKAAKVRAKGTAAKKKPAKKNAGKRAAKIGAPKKKPSAHGAGDSSTGKSSTRGQESRKRQPRKTSPDKVVQAPAASRAAPLGAAGRKPLASSGPRKTARGRLTKKRALAGNLVPARNISLRTSLARRSSPPRRENSETDAQPFDPVAVGFREAAQHDWPAIRRILVEAFGRTDESEIVEALRATRDLAGEYVAEHAGRTVAYVAFCALAAQIDGRAFRAAGLAPLAVAGEFERRGVGTRLTAYGLESVRGLGHAAVFVLGDPAFYGRFGFSGRLAARFASPWSGPFYQALEFEPGALGGEHGETIWPEAFSIL